MKDEARNRTIRMKDGPWEDFKRLLGTEWLAGQIAKAKRREERAKKVKS